MVHIAEFFFALQTGHKINFDRRWKIITEGWRKYYIDFDVWHFKRDFQLDFKRKSIISAFRKDLSEENRMAIFMHKQTFKHV
jgi:hypothetical protein